MLVIRDASSLAANPEIPRRGVVQGCPVIPWGAPVISATHVSRTKTIKPGHPRLPVSTLANGRLLPSSSERGPFVVSKTQSDRERWRAISEAGAARAEFYNDHQKKKLE